MKKVRLVSMVGRFRPGVKVLGYKNPRREKEAPAGWFSTAEVARMLGCQRRSVRKGLHRHDVDWRMVERQGVCACIYWERKGVLDYVKRQTGDAETVERVPDGWMLRRDAEVLLGVAMSSLCRMVKRGLLRELRVRMRHQGLRYVSLLRRDDVLRVAQERKAALRAKLERLSVFSCCVCFAHAVMALAFDSCCDAGWYYGWEYVIPW